MRHTPATGALLLPAGSLVERAYTVADAVFARRSCETPRARCCERSGGRAAKRLSSACAAWTEGDATSRIACRYRDAQQRAIAAASLRSPQIGRSESGKFFRKSPIRVPAPSARRPSEIRPRTSSLDDALEVDVQVLVLTTHRQRVVGSICAQSRQRGEHAADVRTPTPGDRCRAVPAILRNRRQRTRVPREWFCFVNICTSQTITAFVEMRRWLTTQSGVQSPVSSARAANVRKRSEMVRAGKTVCRSASFESYERAKHAGVSRCACERGVGVLHTRQALPPRRMSGRAVGNRPRVRSSNLRSDANLAADIDVRMTTAALRRACPESLSASRVLALHGLFVLPLPS